MTETIDSRSRVSGGNIAHSINSIVAATAPLAQEVDMMFVAEMKKAGVHPGDDDEAEKAREIYRSMDHGEIFTKMVKERPEQVATLVEACVIACSATMPVFVVPDHGDADGGEE